MSDDNEKKVLYDGHYIRMVCRGKWEFVERKNVTGIVGIVAVTDDRKMIFVEQYRAAVDARVIEIPAGLAGDVKGSESEALEIAAARELEEETGYTASKMQRVAEGAASAGIVDEIVTIFRASGLKKTGKGGGDKSEQIEVFDIPLDDVDRWLAERTRAGRQVDLKVWLALYFAKQP